MSASGSFAAISAGPLRNGSYRLSLPKAVRPLTTIRSHSLGACRDHELPGCKRPVSGRYSPSMQTPSGDIVLLARTHSSRFAGRVRFALSPRHASYSEIPGDGGHALFVGFFRCLHARFAAKTTGASLAAVAGVSCPAGADWDAVKANAAIIAVESVASIRRHIS